RISSRPMSRSCRARRRSTSSARTKAGAGRGCSSARAAGLRSRSGPRSGQACARSRSARWTLRTRCASRATSGRTRGGGGSSSPETSRDSRRVRPASRRGSGMRRSLLVLLLLPVLAIADAPAALECSGTGGANRNLAYALTLTALEGNSVVVEDLERRETCTCVFRHDNFFDQSQGVVQQYIVQLKYQLCATECSSTMKRQINASIRVYHRLLGKRSDATPFVGNGAANCDRFSMDLPA